MAELVNKYPQNAAGSFYVDDQCIDCDLCRETAPATFTRNDDAQFPRSVAHKSTTNLSYRLLQIAIYLDKLISSSATASAHTFTPPTYTKGCFFNDC
ncbi:MAG TPA: ferredoxin [Chthoniobacterales bacterium]|nr:ferredoxin [Chthoniobacterales bacterium]